MASKPVELKVEGSQTCSFCQENNPDRTELALLPCRHRLCAHCLQQLSSASAAVSGANCPSCLAVSEVREVGETDEESLVPQPSNNNTPAAPTCANTAGEHGPATVFCTDCNKYYCEKCSKNHELFDFLTGHTLRSVGDMSAEDVKEAESSMCQEHGFPRNIWCKKCHQLMCPSCGLFEHKDHLYQKLADALSEAQKKLDSIIKELEEYMIKQEKNVAELEQTQNDIKSNIQSARKAVEEAAQKFRDIITKHERDLASELDRRETEVLSKLKSVYEESKAKITVARALKQNAERVILIKKPADKIQQAATLQEQQYGMTTSQYQKLKWKMQQNSLGLKELFGKVELTCTKVPPDPPFLGDPLERKLLLCNGVVCGLAIIGNWICAVHYHSSNLWLYDKSRSDKTETCVIQGLTSPKGMVFLKEDYTIAITDEGPGGGKLHLVKFSKDLKMVDHKVKNLPLMYPRRITISEKSEELLIGCFNTSQFVVSTKQGDVIKQVTLTSHDCEHVAGQYPFCVIEMENGFAVLCLAGQAGNYKGTLKLVDKHGKILRSYEEHLFRSRHFVLTIDGSMIIADSGNNRVLLVEGKGKPCQTLLTSKNGLKSPYFLYLDEEAERLHVAHEPGGSLEVRVYKWPPVTGEFSITNCELNVHLSEMP